MKDTEIEKNGQWTPSEKEMEFFSYLCKPSSDGRTYTIDCLFESVSVAMAKMIAENKLEDLERHESGMLYSLSAFVIEIAKLKA